MSTGRPQCTLQCGEVIYSHICAYMGIFSLYALAVPLARARKVKLRSCTYRQPSLSYTSIHTVRVFTAVLCQALAEAPWALLRCVTPSFLSFGLILICAHTVTLSREQGAMTEHRYTKAGIADRVRVQLRNGHQLELPPSFENTFDARVACEMVEVCPPSCPCRSLTRLWVVSGARPVAYSPAPPCTQVLMSGRVRCTSSIV